MLKQDGTEDQKWPRVKKSGGNEKDLWRQVAFLEISKTADDEGPSPAIQVDRESQRTRCPVNLSTTFGGKFGKQKVCWTPVFIQGLAFADKYIPYSKTGKPYITEKKLFSDLIWFETVKEIMS